MEPPKPTDAPWVIDRTGEYTRQPCIRHNGIVLCFLPGERNAAGLVREEDRQRTQATDLANARLLAAAPELLDVVQRAAAGMSWEQLFPLAQAALRRVREGE